jgi:hypothetical protein
VATLDVFRDLVAAAAAETDDAKLTRYLGYAAARLDSDGWGTMYEQACCLLAGHLLVRGSLAGAGGAAAGGVAAESAGGMSRSYGSVAGSMSDADLLTTAPGADFVALRKSWILGSTGLLPDTTYALR